LRTPHPFGGEGVGDISCHGHPGLRHVLDRHADAVHDWMLIDDPLIT
jgi:hypothetical protein